MYNKYSILIIYIIIINCYNCINVKDNKELLINSSSDDISSGSGQNIWNGETCKETTFNFTNNPTTNCPNDCYSMWGQGECDTQTGQCVCNYFYYGDDCSSNFDPDHDWDIMNCNGGRYCPPVYSDFIERECICPNGQQGIDCSVCSNQKGCQLLNNNPNGLYECDTSAFIKKEKSYSCFVTDKDIDDNLGNSSASATFECQFPNLNYNENIGYCSMNLYHKLHGGPLLFDCKFTECNLEILSDKNQSISCQNTTCNCTSYCNIFLEAEIDSAQGPANFLCDPQQDVESPQFSCYFSQKVISELIPIIPFSCIAGECISIEELKQ